MMMANWIIRISFQTSHCGMKKLYTCSLWNMSSNSMPLKTNFDTRENFELQSSSLCRKPWGRNHKQWSKCGPLKGRKHKGIN